MLKQMKYVVSALICLILIMFMSVMALATDTVSLGDGTSGYRNVEILFDEPLENKDVVFALYGNDKLLDAGVAENVTMSGNRVFVSAGSIDEAEYVKAFVFDSLDNVKPYCQPVYADIQQANILPQEDSYVLVDATGIGYLFDTGKLALPSGWISYNKNLGNITNGIHHPIVSDESDTDYSALYRDFDEITSGTITLEFFGSLCSEDNGVYIGFSDSDNNVVCSLSADYGEFVLVGENTVSTGIPVSAKELCEYSVNIYVDVDNKCMSACIDGMYTEKVTLPEDVSLSRLVLSSTVDGTGYILPKHIRMYNNYAVAERFIVTDELVGKAPHSMNVTGNITVEEYISVSQDDKYSAKISSEADTENSASVSFSQITGKGIFEIYILLPEGSDGAFFTLTSGGKNAVCIMSDNGAWYAQNEKMRDFTANVWQTLRIETDLKKQTAIIKICGKTVGEVPISAEYIDGISVGINSNADAVMWFDDILAYNYIDHADYPAMPVSNNDDGYNIGVNVCNLWHDAITKEGWQVASPFAELEPWLGFYDEGSPELADWEIKIMAEHGIDFQHFCWYQPKHTITSPIKTTKKAAPAIHDGYMNAKYSDMVKFCIMWENANSAATKSSFDNFKKYIWSYWKEYYFSDPRYMTLENKPILTVWSLGDMATFFGGYEQAKNAVDFMREDIKTLGYDGLVFLTRSDNGSLVGADAKYFYHYSQDGASADYQINTLEKYVGSEQHNIPTLAMGHNGIGRYDYRAPLISLDGHKKVAEYIRDEYLGNMNTGTWKDNTVFISTWNEYSEGHYICPSGEFGYGYLETIKDVFTDDESEHDELDVKPTEAQKTRITKMYPNTYQPIRIMRYEGKNDSVNLVPIAKWDFSVPEDVAQWSFTGIEVVENTDNGLLFTCTTEDPQMYRYKADINLEEKPVLHVRMKSFEASNMWIWFTTHESPKIGDDIKQINVPLTNIGQMNDYYIDLSSICEWTGTLSLLRIDPVSSAKDFEIELIELLVPEETEEIVLAEWDFSDEKTVSEWSCSNIEVVESSENGFAGRGKTEDPQMYKYNAGIDLSQKPSIHIRMKTSGASSAYIFYSTSENPSIEGKQKFKRFVLDQSGETVDYYVDMSSHELWDGTLKTLRFDPIDSTGSFEIEYIKIFVPQNKDGKVFVNGNEMKFDFRTLSRYGDVQVTANPDLGFFTMLNLHHTWNRYTGTLYVESDYHSLEFRVGSDKAKLDGKSVNLGYTFNLRDGLPVIRIKKFCEMLGFDVTLENDNVYIETGREVIINEKDDSYCWEFNVSGNTEGWYAYDSVIYSFGGMLVAEDVTHPDMHLFPTNVKIDSSKYKTLKIGLYLDPDVVEGGYFQMFYRAGKQSFDEAKSYKHNYDTTIMEKGKLYEFSIDLSRKENWYGIINQLRFDICNTEAEYKIDYIRFLP